MRLSPEHGNDTPSQHRRLVSQIIQIINVNIFLHIVRTSGEIYIKVTLLNIIATVESITNRRSIVIQSLIHFRLRPARTGSVQCMPEVSKQPSDPGPDGGFDLSKGYP